MARRSEPEPHARGGAAAPPADAADDETVRAAGARRLAGVAVEVLAVGRGVIELRGWVPSRAVRTLAGRTALAAPGIESVINSLLVRGEDDLPRSQASRATDQSA